MAVLDSLFFSPQFDLTKDLVVTLDYYTNVPQTVSTSLTSTSATGVFTVGLYDNSLSAFPQGFQNTSLFGLDFNNNLVNVVYQFDGSASGNSNSVNIFSGLLYGGFIQLDYPSIGYQTGVILGSNIPKRIRTRFTNFGNTVICEYWNFTTQTFIQMNSGAWSNGIIGNPGSNCPISCPLSAAGVFIVYSPTLIGTGQQITFTNININGFFTTQYASLCTSSVSTLTS